MAEQKHILIVDDDIELGALLAKAVADMSSSYTVKLARDVDEAMVQVRRSQTTENMFDLVITDIKMTGLNGLELLEALHALVPDLRTIAMTAYTSSEIAGRANELGVQAYLTKPFMISEFRSVVRATLDAPLQKRQPAPEQPGPAPSAHPQREEISRALSSLRTMTAADAAFLLRNDGTLIATDAREPTQDVAELGAALQAAQQAITERMTRLFDARCAVRQSFYGTEAYSVCTYRIDGAYTAAVVFGPEVREGQIWYYMRDAASTLSQVLGREAPSTSSRRHGGGNMLDLLDRFFPGAQHPSADGGPSREAAQPGEPDATEQSPVVDDEALTEAASETSVPCEGEPAVARELDAAAPESAAMDQDSEPEALDPSIADSLDWDTVDGMSWDAILEETDKGWEGMSLEEARRRGLIDDLGSG
jgi:DNA-binding response OmpR family regulator